MYAYVAMYLPLYMYMYICNLRYFILMYVYSEIYGNTLSDLIISSQISKDFIKLPENGTARISFYVRFCTYVGIRTIYIYIYIYVYIYIYIYSYVCITYVHIRDLQYISIRQYIDTLIKYRIAILCSMNIKISDNVDTAEQCMFHVVKKFCVLKVGSNPIRTCQTSNNPLVYFTTS